MHLVLPILRALLPRLKLRLHLKTLLRLKLRLHLRLLLQREQV